MQAFYTGAILISKQNVEIVREALGAAFRRPKPDFAKMNALFDPAHELISRRDALEGGSHRGAHGYRDWLLDTEETLPWESTLDEVTEIDDDRVLALTPTRNTGAASGVVVNQRLAMVLTVRGGRIVRTEVFGSREEALKAVGLGRGARLVVPPRSFEGAAAGRRMAVSRPRQPWAKRLIVVNWPELRIRR